MSRYVTFLLSITRLTCQFEAGPLPSVPTHTKYRKSTYPLSPVQINQSANLSDFSNATSPVADTHTTDLKGKQSVWKRSMNKLFKSKSTTGLRESYRADSNIPPPPMPSLPSDVSSYTAPLNVKKRESSKNRSKHLPTPPQSATRPAFTPQFPSNTNTRSVYSSMFMASPPPSASSASFNHSPQLPSDPFASTFSSSSNNNLPTSASSSHFGDLPPTRPKLPRHSPSLKDLKSFLPSRLAKTKSLANLRVDKDKENSPAPDLPTKESLPSSLSINADLKNPSYPPRPAPVESPPLLPPKPSYFPATAALGRPLSSSTSTSSLTPPPTSPLPPTPPSASSTPLSGPTHTIPLASGSETSSLPRSNSGAVILPRSRSTSMSLRAPPTSSSFFDLYEQLGIWPTPEKDDSEPTKAAEKAEPTSPLESKNKTGLTTSFSGFSNLSSAFEPEDHSSLKDTVSESPSVTFSTSSWQAAIDAFPILDTARSSEAVADMSMDFGLPYVNESSVMAIENENMADHVGDMSLTPEDAVDGEKGRYRSANATAPSTTTQVQQTTGQSSTDLPSRQMSSRRTSGSRSSSRDSRRRSHRHVEGQWYENGESSGSENSEDDDVPLSTLHPQAQAKRQEAALRKASRQADRARRAGKPKVAPSETKRNPGEKWNGEGGAPADILSAKLSALLYKSASMSHLPRSYQNATAGPSGERQRPAPIDTRSVKPQRASTRPFEDQMPHVSTMQRSQTTRVQSQGISPRPAVAGLMSSPVFPNEGFAASSGYPAQYAQTSANPSVNPSPSLPGAAQFSSRGYHISPVPSPTDYYPSHKGKPYMPYGAQVPPPAPSSTSQTMSRRPTVASRDASDSSRRSRNGQSAEVSRSSSGQHPESQSLSRAPTTSRSSEARRHEREPSKTYTLRVEGSAKRIEVQVSASTIVRDVLSRARIECESAGKDRAWVLCEAFGEAGCGMSPPMS